MNRRLTTDFSTQLQAGVTVLNHSRGINRNFTTDLNSTILNNITSNVADYILAIIEEQIIAIQNKKPGKLKYQVDRTKSPLQYNIVDADAGQVSKLKLVRDAAKEVGAKLTQFDQFLHSQYNPEEDFYEEDEYGIRRYDRSKAYARKNAPSVKVKQGTVKPSIKIARPTIMPSLISLPHPNLDDDNNRFNEEEEDEVTMGTGGGGGRVKESKKKVTKDEEEEDL
jgi:hypothetical protein